MYRRSGVSVGGVVVPAMPSYLWVDGLGGMTGATFPQASTDHEPDHDSDDTQGTAPTTGSGGAEGGLAGSAPSGTI